MPLSRIAIAATILLSSSFLRAGGAPKIEFDRTVYDFGTTSMVQSVTGTFRVKNTGDAVLKIEKPTTTCGCTVAAVQPDTLQPGETGELTFTLHLGALRASLAKNINITSNDPKNPQSSLTVKADYVPLFEFAPSVMRMDLIKGSPTNTALTVKRTDGKKLDIAKLEFSNPWISGKAEEDAADPSSARVSIEIKPDGDPRSIYEQIRIFSPEYKDPAGTVFLYGRVIGEILVNPEMTHWLITDSDDITTEAAKTQHTRRFTATASDGARAFELKSVSSSIKELNVELVPKEKGKTYEIVVTLASIPKTSVSGTIELESNLPTQPKVAVPVSVAVMPGKKN